jgi:hypothetical protein
VAVEAGSVRWVTLYDDEHGFSPNYVQSLLPMIGVDLGNQQRLARGGWAFKHAKSYDIAAARNEATVDFLESDVEWMLFIDADMGWEPDALERLMQVADSKDRPIVGALCFGFTPSEDGAGEAQGPFRFPFPTIYDLNETDDDIGFRVRWHYLPSQPQKCGATGAAFLLIHRSALETMRAKHGDKWWSRITHPKAKATWGEDTSFCVRAGTCGIPIHVDSRVRTSHLKPIYVSEHTYMAQIQAPPADTEIDVIVPVLGRPEHAERFMRSLRASTGLAHVTALATEGDDEVIDAWKRHGADVIVNPEARTSFPMKCNDGYRFTTRPWLLFIGSDVVFKPGWWDHALNVARTQQVCMVATNDLCNLDVRDGRLATHPVIRRSYIDDHGASWDGPGVVAHEGYRHGWVDAEWTTTAAHRGTFAPAFASHVEHLHPLAGKAERDYVYELGAESIAVDSADGKLFAERLGANT